MYHPYIESATALSDSSIYTVVSKIVAQLQHRSGLCSSVCRCVTVWLAVLYNYNEISVLGACMRQILNTDSVYNCLFNVHFPSCSTEQTILSCLMLECQWCHWMKQGRSESLGADLPLDLVKWSLVTLCSTGEGAPPITPLTQCLALQPHTPSPTSILVQFMKWELHQLALLNWLNTAVGVGSRLPLTTVSVRSILLEECIQSVSFWQAI